MSQQAKKPRRSRRVRGQKLPQKVLHRYPPETKKSWAEYFGNLFGADYGYTALVDLYGGVSPPPTVSRSSSSQQVPKKSPPILIRRNLQKPRQQRQQQVRQKPRQQRPRTKFPKSRAPTPSPPPLPPRGPVPKKLSKRRRRSVRRLGSRKYRVKTSKRRSSRKIPPPPPPYMPTVTRAPVSRVSKGNLGQAKQKLRKTRKQVAIPAQRKLTPLEKRVLQHRQKLKKLSSGDSEWQQSSSSGKSSVAKRKSPVVLRKSTVAKRKISRRRGSLPKTPDEIKQAQKRQAIRRAQARKYEQQKRLALQKRFKRARGSSSQQSWSES